MPLKSSPWAIVLYGALLGTLILALPACAATRPAATSAAVQMAPEVVTRDFYAWYLRTLDARREPGRADSATLNGFVSAAGRREARADRSGADYFLKAQDYLEDWPTRIAVAPAVIRGGTATTSVILGGSPASVHRLRVTLVRESGRWMIRRVAGG